METAKIFENGRSQAVRLPKKFRFDVDEVVVQQLGDAVILVPRDSLWKTFLEGLDGTFSTVCGLVGGAFWIDKIYITVYTISRR